MKRLLLPLLLLLFFGHKALGMTARDDFCKLYGVEFDNKYDEIY